MLSNECSFTFINHISWLCITYVIVKISLILWPFINNYIITIYRKPIDFKSYGKWAVITGSTDGIGKGFAKELASNGVSICLISRNGEKLKNTAKEIEISYGVETKYIVADFTDPNVYEHIKKNMSDLDIGILVNNVGTSPDNLEPLSDHNEQIVTDMINVNIMSLTRMTHLVLPYMLAKRRGLILNIGSLSTKLLTPGILIYSATKAYMTTFGSHLRYELKKHNIQVTTFIPGLISTTLFQKYSSYYKLIKLTFPIGIVSVEKFVKSALITLRSGCYLTCGYFVYDIILAGYQLVPKEIFSDLIFYTLENMKK